MAAILRTLLRIALGLLIMGRLSEGATTKPAVKSEDILVPMGTNTSVIYCEWDSSYKVCTWSFKDKSCSAVRDNIGQALDCGIGRRVRWSLTSTRCGIRIQGATREDVGSYDCELIRKSAQADGAFEDVKGRVNVDVSVPPTVVFQGQFAKSPDVEVDEGVEVEVTCEAKNGYPEPELIAVLSETSMDSAGKDPAGQDVQLMESLPVEVTRINKDGTTIVRRTFSFIPTIDDCGKQLKCKALTRDPKGSIPGNLLYETQESRNLMVTFAPTGWPGPAPIFRAIEGVDDRLEVTLTFEANPVPLGDHVIWNINTNGGSEPSQATITLKSDDKLSDKYLALPLNVTVHQVSATLVILDPNVLDSQYIYFLEVNTPKGAQNYYFRIEVMTESQAANGNELDNSPHHREDHPEADAAGLGLGAIVAIVVVPLIAAVIIIAVVYANKSRKCCFGYSSVSSRPDVEVVVTTEAKDGIPAVNSSSEGPNGNKPIIKRGFKPKGMPKITPEVKVLHPADKEGGEGGAPADQLRLNNEAT